MNNKLENIVVTGGAGYIGSHACKALSRAGFVPICYDNLSRGHDWTVKWGPLEKGDILDKARLSDVFNQYQPLAVMHFAALAYVGESVTSPLLYYRNNVVGTHTLLQSMMAHGIKNFIFSSTCAIYGNPMALPINESHQISPINPYGNTKATVEFMLNDLSINNELNYVSLRYFNAAGADIDGDIGECHEPETHLIPLVLEAAAGKRPHIQIFGDDYDTPDGTCIRDYIHVTDLINAHIVSLEHLLNDGDSRCYNLGAESGYSVKQIIDAACTITGNNIISKISARRPGDPPSLISDSSKIRNDFSWKPVHSDIDLILQSAWRWHNNN